jgi:glycyl-tRNA synthetase beta chain
VEYSYDVVKAVLGAEAEDVVDALARAEAVKQFLHMPEFQAIGAACKRMRNILKQAEEKGIAIPRRSNFCLIPLWKRRPWQPLSRSTGRKWKRCRRKRNTARRCCFAFDGARNLWTRFFDKVMVMVEDASACGRTGWHCCGLC